MQSVDFYASSEEGCEGEGGGRHGAKINEFQAAWNVTNAIQVCTFSTYKYFFVMRINFFKLGFN